MPVVIMCGWMGRRDQDERYTKERAVYHKFILQLYFDGSLASLAGWLPTGWLASLCDVSKKEDLICRIFFGIVFYHFGAPSGPIST